MRAIAIIPARMGSSRFPGKPMVEILGLPMIAHCYFRAKMCEDLSEVYVATCDKEIFDYITSIGGKAVMTLDTHERASDRAAEAMLKVEEETGVKSDVVFMIQGDEPLVTPNMISRALEPMKSDDTINVVNLMADIRTETEFEDPNEIKVVVDKNNDAIYFSREPIPSRAKFDGNIKMLKQVCVIPFKRDYLLRFNNLSETDLEVIESIDMNRILSHGEKVKMVYIEEDAYSVDTPQDRDNVEELMKSDSLKDQYLKN